MPVSWNVDPKILTDPDVVTNPFLIKVRQPFVSDKLSVSQKAVNVINAEQVNVPIDQINTLCCG
jgi:hypothetical protein